MLLIGHRLIRDNRWRQGMMGGIKAQYDCIQAFSAPTTDGQRESRHNACSAGVD